MPPPVAREQPDFHDASSGGRGGVYCLRGWGIVRILSARINPPGQSVSLTSWLGRAYICCCKRCTTPVQLLLLRRHLLLLWWLFLRLVVLLLGLWVLLITFLVGARRLLLWLIALLIGLLVLRWVGWRLVRLHGCQEAGTH